MNFQYAFFFRWFDWRCIKGHDAHPFSFLSFYSGISIVLAIIYLRITNVFYYFWASIQKMHNRKAKMLLPGQKLENIWSKISIPDEIILYYCSEIGYISVIYSYIYIYPEYLFIFWLNNISWFFLLFSHEIHFYEWNWKLIYYC